MPRWGVHLVWSREGEMEAGSSRGRSLSKGVSCILAGAGPGRPWKPSWTHGTLPPRPWGRADIPGLAQVTDSEAQKVTIDSFPTSASSSLSFQAFLTPLFLLTAKQTQVTSEPQRRLGVSRIDGKSIQTLFGVSSDHWGSLYFTSGLCSVFPIR